MQVRRSHAPCIACAALALGLVPASAAASDDQQASPLVAVVDADPLELARVVARVGDPPVRASLAAGRPSAERLAAVRGASWLRAPELALPELVAMLEGRDSELAPAAARAVVQIAMRLDVDELARREVLPETLAAVRARLLAAAERGALRADIRAMAAEAAARLAAAGVP